MAQWIAHQTSDLGVGGSSPPRDLMNILFLFFFGSLLPSFLQIASLQVWPRGSGAGCRRHSRKRYGFEPHSLWLSFCTSTSTTGRGGVAHSVERSVRNRQAQGLKPCSSNLLLCPHRSERQWCIGNIEASQALAPGSTPGWRRFLFTPSC